MNTLCDMTLHDTANSKMKMKMKYDHNKFFPKDTFNNSFKEEVYDNFSNHLDEIKYLKIE